MNEETTIEFDLSDFEDMDFCQEFADWLTRESLPEGFEIEPVPEGK